MSADPAPMWLPSKPCSVEEVIERIPSHRQSTLAAFDSCNLTGLFNIRYGWGWGGPEAAVGVIFHRVAAEALETLRRTGENSIPVAECLEILYEVAAQRDVPPWDRVMVPMRLWPRLRMAVIKFAKDNTFTIEKVAGIEQRLEAQIPYQLPDGRMITRKFTGQLDVLIYDPPDGAVVIDFKTGQGLPPAARETDDFFNSEGEATARLSIEGYFQQRAYGMLVMKALPVIQRVTLREFYVLKSEARSATIYRADLEHVEREVRLLMQDLDRAIAAGPRDAGRGNARDPWRAQPGSHCSYCKKPAACPIELDVRGDGAIDSPETAARYAAEFQVSDAVRKNRRGALKVWADQNGSVELRHSKGRRAIGFVKTETGGQRFEVFTPDASDKGPAAPDLTQDPKLEAAFIESANELMKTKARARKERKGRKAA